MMLSNPDSSVYQTPRCFVTSGTLGHVDSVQTSCGRKPWVNLRNMGFIQRVDLIMSQNSVDGLQEILGSVRLPSYCRFTMTLAQVLEKEFFTSFIKAGDILMMTEGKKSVDDMFTIEKGILSMYIGKETYERGGLVGKPYGAKGGRKLRPRWVVTFDLNSPTMIHGKKGFDRLLYACHTVFTEPLVWLFSDDVGRTPATDSRLRHSPQQLACTLERSEHMKTNIIALHLEPTAVTNGDRSAMEESATALYEWLSLVRLKSPRIKKGDNIDGYLSRYEESEAHEGHLDVCVLSWNGLISSTWLHQLALDVVKTLPQGSWFALSATEVSTSLSGASREVVLLRPDQPHGEYVMWEVQSSE